MLLDSWSVLGTTFLFCLGSAVIPFLYAEPYLLGAAALRAPAELPALVVAATLGQMVGKAILYGLGDRSLRFLPPRWRRIPPGVQERIASSRLGVGGMVLLSAFVGFPPFYAVTLLAGGLRFSLLRFLAAGTLGRLVRFAALMALPLYARSLVR